MKRFSLLNIFVFSLLITSLYSCGGSNSTDAGGSDENISSNPVTNNVSGATDGAETFDGFTKEVEDGNFKKLDEFLSLYGYSGDDFNGKIYYTKMTQQESNQSFSDSLENMFDFETCSGYQECQDLESSMYGIRRIKDDNKVERNSNFNIDSQFGDSLVDIKAKLVSLMKNADRVAKCDSYGTCYDVESFYAKNYLANQKSKRYAFEHNGDQYMVDLSYPLAANPVKMYDESSGVIYSF